MNRLKDLWGGQDAINRVAFIAAIAAFAWCIVQGHGLYGVVFAVVILFLIISRQNQREKRFSRLYGTMYFPMPDGELVPRSFEQVKNEYVHGAQSNYADRKVELRFPWWYLNSAGDIDTGFGLTVRIGDKQELADEARLLFFISVPRACSGRTEPGFYFSFSGYSSFSEMRCSSSSLPM